MTKDEFDAETRARFAKWDENGDGVVDRAEAEKRVSGRMERRMQRRGGRSHGKGMGHGMHDGRGMGQGMGPGMMRRLDEDHDGIVTESEVDAYVTRMFSRMDLNGDGRITDADLPPMMRGLDVIKEGGMPGWAEGRGHGGGGQGRRAHGGGMLRHMLGADTNKDGEITIEEARALAAKRFGRFDRNGDGKIDDADRAALRKEMIEYRVLRFFHHFGAKPEEGLTREAFTAYRNERFERRDVDGDGEIERGEMHGGSHHGRGDGGWGRDRGAEEGRGDDGPAPDAPSDAPRQ